MNVTLEQFAIDLVEGKLDEAIELIQKLQSKNAELIGTIENIRNREAELLEETLSLTREAVKLKEAIVNNEGNMFLISVFADIRMATGVNEKPMLSELAQAIKEKFDSELARKDYMFKCKHEFWYHDDMWRLLCSFQCKTFVHETQDGCIDQAITAMKLL